MEKTNTLFQQSHEMEFQTLQNVDREVQYIIEQARPGRPTIEAHAIDTPDTKRPEDAIGVISAPDKRYFHISIPEVGLLDRGGASVRRMVDSLHVSGKPRIALPQHRGSFYFREGIAIPALTLIGTLNAKGPDNLDLIRTNVAVKKCSTESAEIVQQRDYHLLEDTARGLSRTALRKKWHTPKFVHRQGPQQTVETYMNMLNLGVAELTKEAKLPQLLTTYTEPNGTQGGVKEISAQMGIGHDAFQRRDYTNVTNPIRGLRDHINSVSLSHFMDTGESLLSPVEANMLAKWLNEENARSMNHKAEKIGVLTTKLAA